MTLWLAIDRADVADYLNTLLLVYIVLIFVRIIMTWLPRIPYNRYLDLVLTFVRAAMSRVGLRVHMDIVPSSQMLIDPSDTVVLLPAATRYETPGGVTEKGLITLEERGLREVCRAAVDTVVGATR